MLDIQNNKNLNVVGFGVDILQVKRIKKSYLKFGNLFLKKILTEKEQKKFASISNDKKKILYISKCFAIKEAASKAIGTGLKNGLYFTNIEYNKDSQGKPFVILKGDISLKYEKNSFLVSVSDEKKYVLASVLMFA